MDKKDNKKGWTLIELAVALVILSILLGISVQIIKTRKIKIVPYTYTGVANLTKANNIIMEKYNDYTLPETAVTGQDVYCARIADVFNTVTTPKCDITCSGTPLVCAPPVVNQMNFQVANQVSYSGLNNPWQTDDKNRSFKTIIMDINGGTDISGVPNCPSFSQAGTPLANNIHIGKECFQLNVFRDGSIAPTGKCLNEKNVLLDCTDTNFPFGYDVWEVRTPTDEDIAKGKCFENDPDCKVTERIYINVGYTEAICVSDANIDDETRTILTQTCEDKGFELDTKCGTDSSQFCIIRPSKPALAVGFRY